MSSSPWNDLTCSQQSSALSCLAMRDLALKEYEEDRTQMEYMIHDTSCERYHSIFDRGELNGSQLSRRLCFTHDPTLKMGLYQGMFVPINNPQYDQWTRRKDISSKPVPSSTTPINANVWNNQNDDGSAIQICGSGGIFNPRSIPQPIPYGPSARDQSSVPGDFLQKMGCCK